MLAVLLDIFVTFLKLVIQQYQTSVPLVIGANHMMQLNKYVQQRLLQLVDFLTRANAILKTFLLHVPQELTQDRIFQVLRQKDILKQLNA